MGEAPGHGHVAVCHWAFCDPPCYGHCRLDGTWQRVTGPFVTLHDMGAGGDTATPQCPEDATGQDGTEWGCEEPLRSHLIPC